MLSWPRRKWAQSHGDQHLALWTCADVCWHLPFKFLPNLVALKATWAQGTEEPPGPRAQGGHGISRPRTLCSTEPCPSTRGLSCGRTSQPRSRAAGPWVAGRGSAGLLGQVAVTSCPLQTHPDGGGCFGAKWEELQRAAWVLTMEVPPAESPAAQGTWDRPAEPKSPWGFIGSSGRRTAPSDVPTLVPEPVYVSHDVAKGTLPCERALKAGSVLAPGTCLTHGP